MSRAAPKSANKTISQRQTTTFASVGSKPIKKSATLVKSQTYEHLFSVKWNKLVQGCTWLDDRSIAFTTLLEEIALSIDIDPDSTMSLLTDTNVSARDVYWLLPSMRQEEESFNANIKHEFSVIKGVILEHQCKKCKRYEYYVDLKQLRSADEPSTEIKTCATCNPRIV